MALSFNSQKKEGTMIVDALNLAFRWKHQGRTDFRYEYEKTVHSLADSYKCKDVILTADGGASAYRKAILPDYKQNRKTSMQLKRKKKKLRLKNFSKSTKPLLICLVHFCLYYDLMG